MVGGEDGSTKCSRGWIVAYRDCSPKNYNTDSVHDGGGRIVFRVVLHLTEDRQLALARPSQKNCAFVHYSGVTRGPPRVTPSRGVTPEGKIFCGQIYKE